jgi:glycosyltransferase involved in cell wall biosynthesis
MPHEQLKTLFISYDGLLDPLGGSQILPYIESISAHPRNVHIISFEKKKRLHDGKNHLHKMLSARGINWTPISFTYGLGLVGKIWDLMRMYFFGFLVAISEKPKIIHARGHSAAQVGLFLKRCLGLKLIFDFRGLWVDERVDKGGWDLTKPFHRLQYRHFKRIEQKLLHHADQIVVLTESVVDEVVRLGAQSADKITVIPCCADFDHFLLADEAARVAARYKSGNARDAFVLGYLGSVGGMYMPNRFFRFFELAVAAIPNVQALALTPDLESFNAAMHESLRPELHRFVRAYSASRDEVPKFLPAMDVLVSFIQPSYARLASSPTKLAESLAAGIPVICNRGVGDVEALMVELDAGLVVDVDSDDILNVVANALVSLPAKGGLRLRNAARWKLGLEVAADRYLNVYRRVDA